MAKVMMYSEIVEALATLAAHGIEAMKGEPKVAQEVAGCAHVWDRLTPEGEFRCIHCGLPKSIKRGFVSDDEIENCLWSPQTGCAHDISIDVAREILTRFARARGIL